jgi:hypothetical protein
MESDKGKNAASPTVAFRCDRDRLAAHAHASLWCRRNGKSHGGAERFAS